MRLGKPGRKLGGLDSSALHTWYQRACTGRLESRAEETLARREVLARAEALTAAARGPRPPLAKGADDRGATIQYLGGNPDAWWRFGCHPARFHVRPIWPPAEGPRRIRSRRARRPAHAAPHHQPRRQPAVGVARRVDGGGYLFPFWGHTRYVAIQIGNRSSNAPSSY